MKPGLAATLTDKTQSKQISFLFGAVAFIGGVSGLLIYFQKRKFSKEQAELFALEKEIKLLTLKKLKGES
tara:strand:+ start:358 stop:567 length:210 start_codon:yes stop_codon:yes gene_type:complete